MVVNGTNIDDVASAWKQAARTAEEEAAFIAKRDETTPGNEWERVAFLLDLTGSKKTVKDTSRTAVLHVHRSTQAVSRGEGRRSSLY